MKSTVKLLAAIVLAGCVDARANPVGISANQIRTAAPGALTLSGVAAAEGTSQAICRADHAHSITGVLPVANGGTGAAAQNFVDLTMDQSIAGVKTFTTKVIVTAAAGQAGVTATAGAGNFPGGSFTGGSGFLSHSHGVDGTGGPSGPGGNFVGGSGNGQGAICTATGTANGAVGLGAGSANPSSTSSGGSFVGAAAGGPGVTALGVGSGNGVNSTGGASSVAGGNFSAGPGSNGDGVRGNGDGSGAGGRFTGGGAAGSTGVFASAASGSNGWGGDFFGDGTGIGLRATGGGGGGSGQFGVQAVSGNGGSPAAYFDNGGAGSTAATVRIRPVSSDVGAVDGDVWINGSKLGVRSNGANYFAAPLKAGTCTLGTNCAAIALPTTMACTCTDTTAFNPCKATPPSNSVTFNGTGTDVLVYTCIVQQ